jgi:Flp pilus assembly protein TadG
MVNPVAEWRDPELEARAYKGADIFRAILRTLGIARAKAMSLGRDEFGTVAMYAVAVPVFAGVVAVGAETGNFYRLKRQMQNAADDAALAASIDSLAGKPTSTIIADAQYEAQRNGFQNGVNNLSVTVNSPPASGPNVGTQGAVEVIITKGSQSFIFGKALTAFVGGASNPFTLKARAVAAKSTYTKSGQTTNTTANTTTTTNSVGCMVALTPNAEQGINLSSFNNFTSDCSVLSNGTVSTSDSNASIYATSFNTAYFKSIWTRGSFYQTSSNKVTYDSMLTNQTTSIVDPYSSLGTPSPGTCSFTNFSAPKGSSVTLTPGTYCGGLVIKGGVNKVYFTAGTYYIANGDLYITGVNNVSCSNCVDGQTGVTIVLTQTTGNNNDIGGFKITSDNNVTLSAPPSGPYKGVLVYQDRNVPVGTMSSTSKIFTLTSLNNAKLSGAIYFPNNRIDISSLNNSGNSTQGCTVWVGRYIKFSSYNNNWIAGCGLFGTTPMGYQTTTTTTTTTTGTEPVQVTTSRVVE